MIDKSELSNDMHIIADEYSLGFATNEDTGQIAFLIAFKGTRNMGSTKVLTSVLVTQEGALELAQNIANELMKRAMEPKEDKTN